MWDVVLVRLLPKGLQSASRKFETENSSLLMLSVELFGGLGLLPSSGFAHGWIGSWSLLTKIEDLLRPLSFAFAFPLPFEDVETMESFF